MFAVNSPDDEVHLFQNPTDIRSKTWVQNKYQPEKGLKMKKKVKRPYSQKVKEV